MTRTAKEIETALNLVNFTNASKFETEMEAINAGVALCSSNADIETFSTKTMDDKYIVGVARYSARHYLIGFIG